jgi:probable LLM family oxidoreductase
MSGFLQLTTMVIADSACEMLTITSSETILDRRGRMLTMKQRLELGLDTFGDITESSEGNLQSYAHVIRDVVEQAVLADELGVDFFGVGEHHRDDFAVSSPEMVLAGIAGRTTRIRLGSAVTVMSSDDPVRVFERFATLDAVSNGRAELILGRGSFTESFPLFGYDLKDYEILFEEKVGLFAELLKEGPVSWRGTTRSALSNQRVYPTTESGHLATWIGVGGSPKSVVRAARYGMPLVLAIIGGDPTRFKPFLDLYYRELDSLGTVRLPVAVHSPGFVADTDDDAKNQLWPYMKQMRDRIGAERGWGPVQRADFENDAGPHGSWYVGSPETVARKIAATATALGLSRFDMKYSAGRLPHSLLMRSIELYGSRVIPLVHDMMS